MENAKLTNVVLREAARYGNLMRFTSTPRLLTKYIYIYLYISHYSRCSDFLFLRRRLLFFSLVDKYSCLFEHYLISKQENVVCNYLDRK